MISIVFYFTNCLQSHAVCSFFNNIVKNILEGTIKQTETETDSPEITHNIEDENKKKYLAKKYLALGLLWD